MTKANKAAVVAPVLGSMFAVLWPAGTAQAAVATKGPDPANMNIAVTTAYQTDPWGHPIGAPMSVTTKQWAVGTTAPSAPLPALPASEGVTATPATTGGGGPAPWDQGCVSIETVLRQTTNLGYTAWRLHGVEGWCYDKIAGTAGINDNRHWFSDVDSQHQLGTVQHNDEWYYNAWGGKGHETSGAETYYQQTVTNCILNWGCIGTAQPSIRLIGFADGAWYSDTNV